MKLLFVLFYPGHLRYFDSSLRLLAEAGHTVYLIFDNREKQKEGLETLNALPENIIVLNKYLKRADAWKPIAAGLRILVDYINYLDPQYIDSHYLRDRWKDYLERTSPKLHFVAKIRTLPRFLVKFFIRVLLTLEKAIPPSEKIQSHLSEIAPDLVLVTSMVMKASPQTDVVKTARAMGLKVGYCVSSWDNLTTKGLIRVQPDRVIVWNEIQKVEAQTIHDVPPAKIICTGAHPFDRWFSRQPSITHEAFCQKVGLPADKPFVLFLGSTAGISAHDDEQKFVRQWIKAIRESHLPSIQDLGILIRPHPYNSGNWKNVDLSDLNNVALWPKEGANPVNESDRSDYFDSLYHCVAVVGINTSAMLEAAIVGRSVHTILASDFQNTQSGTLHFRYLLPENGGFVKVAATLDEHLQQLCESLNNPEETQETIRQFVQSFIRPHGLDRPAGSVFVEAIETLAKAAPEPPRKMSPLLYPLSLLLLLAGPYILCTPEKASESWRRSRDKLVEGLSGFKQKLKSLRGTG